MAVKLECANCGVTQQVPENPSLKRLDNMVDALAHTKFECDQDNVFLRTFPI